MQGEPVDDQCAPICTAAMRAVSCVGGETQIERVLAHAIAETKRQRVNALVFVGDAMEENVDRLCRTRRRTGAARRAGLPLSRRRRPDRRVGLPADRASVARRLLRFDAGSAEQLRDLLGAVAVYAAGGYRALSAYGEKKGGEVLRLTAQLRG